jgi:hypothetical protein
MKGWATAYPEMGYGVDYVKLLLSGFRLFALHNRTTDHTHLLYSNESYLLLLTHVHVQ